jgi:predicted ABC-type exoprotein transport system permease subunit
MFARFNLVMVFWHTQKKWRFSILGGFLKVMSKLLMWKFGISHNEKFQTKNFKFVKLKTQVSQTYKTKHNQ